MHKTITLFFGRENGEFEAYSGYIEMRSTRKVVLIITFFVCMGIGLNGNRGRDVLKVSLLGCGQEGGKLCIQ